MNLLSVSQLTESDLGILFCKGKVYVYKDGKALMAVKALHSDGGGEFVNGEMRGFCDSKGTKHSVTSPHTPQQNGIAERLNRTLVDCANVMLLHARVPVSLAPCT